MTSLAGLQEALKQSVVPSSGFAAAFIGESIAILEQVDVAAIERMALGLARVRELGGRLFILGVGGSAGHASHAVNEGWDTCFAGWLHGSRIGPRDGVLVFSVGGGNREKNVSVNIVRALETAAGAGARIFGIVGPNGGFTRQVSEECLVIPVLARDRITPHTEGLCAVLWHLLVSHPLLQRAATKWESIR